MKALVVLFFAATPVFAANDFTRAKCDFEDFNEIQNALKSGPVIGEAERKDEVLSLLQQEMGPMCFVLVPKHVGAGIPGDHTRFFELTGNGKTYELSHHTSVEIPGNSGISIQLKK